MIEPAHILIVDDDIGIRRMLQLLLHDAGYRVSTADSGEEALAYLELVTPDLILLDLMLPGLSGNDVARQIKAHPTWPFIPIILITARSDSRTKVSGLDAGADDFLTKPIEFAELLARVRALLRLQRAQRSLQAEQRKTELLLNLTSELGISLDLDALLTHFLEKLGDAIGAVRASAILISEDPPRFYSSSRHQAVLSMQDVLSRGVAGWVLREKQPLLIADCSEDERWIASGSYSSAVRSVAAAPIMRDNRALGVITAVHHTPNHFTEEHLALLTLVAQQSAFALENAELYHLTRSQKDLLERRTEDLQRLNEISRHLSELMQPELLLRLVAHLMHHTFRYPQVVIYLREGGSLRVRAIAGDLLDDRLLGSTLPADYGVPGWVVQNQKVLRIDHAPSDTRYAALGQGGAIGSELAAPIFAGREFYGVLEIASAAQGTFTPNDEQLLDTLASQIGIALDNARLFENEKRRVRQLAQVSDLSVAITAQLDRTHNLQIAADALLTIFGIERSAIIMYDKDLRQGFWATGGSSPASTVASVNQILFPPEGMKIHITSPVISTSIAENPLMERYLPLLQTENIEALAIAPLMSQGSPIGVVTLDISSRVDQFGQAELTLLATVASLIGQVVENDRLYREVEDERRTLNAVLDGAADPILLIGPHDRLLLSNRAAAHQLGISNANGMPIAALIQEPDLLHALRGPTNGHGPHEVTLDEETTFSISVAQVQNGQNSVLGRVAVLQDITAIKELERREQERLRGALRRYVSPQVVEQMLAGGNDFGTPMDHNVVVLFADLRGYTALTEGIPARVLVEQVLNRYFTAMTEVLYHYEGTIDKFLGDGIIGVFGTPIAHRDDLERALRASVDLQRAFNRLRAEWWQQLHLDIGMGIGLGYGHAVVGNIGSAQRTDFTLVGDVVNTASRLSGLALAGQIVVSHQLIDALPARAALPFGMRELGRIPLKGKQDPHQIYEIEYEEKQI